ncbi:MAG: response regulator, partial [Myxococcales bacterium]|nr:response regulator [Myxococcales bacterium]
MGVSLDKPSVLVVDDDPVTLRVTAALLEREGYRVATRDQALGTAVEILRSQPDFVLLDVNMPEMDGFTVAQRLGASMPVTLMLSSSDLSSDTARCRQ